MGFQCHWVHRKRIIHPFVFYGIRTCYWTSLLPNILIFWLLLCAVRIVKFVSTANVQLPLTNISPFHECFSFLFRNECVLFMCHFRLCQFCISSSLIYSILEFLFHSLSFFALSSPLVCFRSRFCQFSVSLCVVYRSICTLCALLSLDTWRFWCMSSFCCVSFVFMSFHIWLKLLFLLQHLPWHWLVFIYIS
jgi:hypothetical protein